jgi:hypothetical protein
VFFVHDKYFAKRCPIWNDGNLKSYNPTSIFFLLSSQEGKKERNEKKEKKKIKRDILLERHAYNLAINHPYKVITFTTQGHCNSDIFTWI